ncbi:hypothetical protein DK419_26180 [Methylobacterium terrae]|uniref:Uncharacterized protein n=1 Tax=Methylobacterium terrae TaxID=2202827 RepID=A0A2U8WXW6_9HYPH|nr:hypothetical protein [Methylobacterium terrae]AWN50261.1 hypothetical protein DK419_26180 [Methylobacterium terrae]
MDEIRQIRAQAQQDLAASLARIPGGRALIDWFDGAPEFGDAEVVSLLLDRRGPSTLRIALDHHGKSATFVFELAAWIDADVRGFSHQNVIGSLTLRRAEEREVQPWELGVGCRPGEWMIECGPCFGAYGTIRADIARITLEQAPDA